MYPVRSLQTSPCPCYVQCKILVCNVLLCPCHLLTPLVSPPHQTQGTCFFLWWSTTFPHSYSFPRHLQVEPVSIRCFKMFSKWDSTTSLDTRELPQKKLQILPLQLMFLQLTANNSAADIWFAITTVSHVQEHFFCSLMPDFLLCVNCLWLYTWIISPERQSLPSHYTLYSIQHNGWWAPTSHYSSLVTYFPWAYLPTQEVNHWVATLSTDKAVWREQPPFVNG